MAGELESGTIWWDLSGLGRLQPPAPPFPTVGQFLAGSVAGPVRGLATPWRRLPRFQALTFLIQKLMEKRVLFFLTFLEIKQKSD